MTRYLEEMYPEGIGLERVDSCIRISFTGVLACFPKLTKDSKLLRVEKPFDEQSFNELSLREAKIPERLEETPLVWFLARQPSYGREPGFVAGFD
jgi:hypothetical protein